MFNYTEIKPEECEFVEVAAEDELEEGSKFYIEIDREQIVLFNIAGELFAIGDICSHDDGPLGDGELEDFEVTCPRHGARFDVRTGKAVKLPAVVDIPAFPVRVVDGKIEIGLPIE